tara:strand:- start:876 stop:1748 length:873 start_codon:yes stop_codon:yes gene_type:complete
MIEIVYNQTTKLDPYHLKDGRVPVSVAAELRDESGASILTPSVTVSAASTTTTAATTQALTVASATGFSVGDYIALTSDGVAMVAHIERIDGLILHLYSALPVAPDNGSTVANTRMDVAIAAPGAAEIGSNYQLSLQVTTASDIIPIYEQAVVVRHGFGKPCVAVDVREVMTHAYRETASNEFCEIVARDVNTKIRTQVEATGRRPHLYLGDAKHTFSEAIQLAIRIKLTEVGIGPMTDSIAESAREFRYQFDNEMARVLKGLSGYDKNNDGAIDGEEAKAPIMTVYAVR